MALADMQAASRDHAPETVGPLFEGVLIFSPTEAPDLTVIEHPLDYVGNSGLPMDLGRVLDKYRLYTFDSTLETRHRQYHGLSLRIGDTVLRQTALSRGYDTGVWDWIETGEPLPFEDPKRLGKTRIWERLDRALLFDYAAKLGLNPARSLFERELETSVLYYPVAPDRPEAAKALSDIDPTTAFAAGVEPTIGMAVADTDFPEHASLMAAMMRWERLLDQARWKAAQSATRAKTQKGRERAQWRVIDTIRDVTEDMQNYDLDHSYTDAYLSQLNSVMHDLGPKSEAYQIYRGLCRKPFWTFGNS